jgi:Subtilase family
VLTRFRIAVLVGLSVVLVTATTGAVGAQAETGSRGSAAAHAASGSQVTTGADFPAGAKALLSSELTQAWQITRGQGVTIAVLRTAVDAVSGLAGKVTLGPDYAPLAGAPTLDGTILASLIAGSGPTGTNPFGPIGRAPGAKILAEQIADFGAGQRGQMYEQDGTWQTLTAKAIRYAVDHGAGVIVTFEGTTDDTSALDSAVAYAISKNVIVLGSAAAYSGDPSPLAFPDSLPGVINFTGVPITGLPQRPKPPPGPANDSVLVAAPDNALPATGPGNAPYTAWGSYAEIAWVAGTVALLKSVYPGITPAQAARALAESASYHPAGGYNATVGFGLINPVGALHDAAALVKLGTRAASAAGTIKASARFGTPAAAVIEAVHHPTVTLAGSGAAIFVGLILLGLAAVLIVRRRRAAAIPPTAVPMTAGPATAGLPTTVLPATVLPTPPADLPPLGPAG